MGTLLAILRIIPGMLIFFVGGLFVIALAWLPVRIRGIRLSAWPISMMARWILAILGIRLSVSGVDRLINHHGLVFPNHVSFVDVIVLGTIMPFRFLGNSQVRKFPLIPLLAIAVDAIVMDESDRESRKTARQAVAERVRQQSYPPLVLFPEGSTSDGASIGEFRYGAFEIAMEEKIAFLPCVLHYDPVAPIAWYEPDETLFQSLWRLAHHRGRIQARLEVLEAVQPQATDEAPALAQATQAQMVDTYMKRPH